MSVDYNAMDEEADTELAEAYGTESADSPDEGTESQEVTATEPEGTPDAEVVEEHAQDSEPVVAESRYKEAVRAMNRAQQELAEYRKQSDHMIAQLQEQVAALQTKQVEPSEDETDLSEAKELYPEVVNPLLKTIESLKKQLAKVTEDVTGVQGFAARYQQSEAQTAEERHFAEIHSVHPDAEQLASTEDFRNWANAQAPMIQMALQQGTAKDVIAALNLYRAESGKPAPVSNKTDKLAAARDAAVPTVRGSGKPESKQTYTADQIAKMSRAEFLKHEAAIDEAMARGEIY